MLWQHEGGTYMKTFFFSSTFYTEWTQLVISQILVDILRNSSDPEYNIYVMYELYYDLFLKAKHSMVFIPISYRDLKVETPVPCLHFVFNNSKIPIYLQNDGCRWHYIDLPIMYHVFLTTFKSSFTAPILAFPPAICSPIHHNFPLTIITPLYSCRWT